MAGLSKSEFDHAEMVRALAKPGEDIIASLTPEKAHLLHMAYALAGEVGELLDGLKKYVIYGKKDLDISNIVEELGDMEFFMEGIRSPLGITRKQTLEQNVAKLSKRYEGGTYSNAAALERADKSEA